MLHFSLDSSERDEHDRMRGVKCFDSVIESIQLACDLGQRPDILFTVFNENIHELEKVYRKISKPRKLILIINPVFEYGGIGDSLSENNLNYLDKWVGKPLIYLNKSFIKLRRDGGNHIEDPICKAASTSIVISPENKLVLPCYHLGLEEFPIESNLESLWNSSEIRELRSKEGKYKKCEGCTINCYMEPSFAVDINKYFRKSLGSSWKYNRMKGTWKELI